MKIDINMKILNIFVVILTSQAFNWNQSNICHYSQYMYSEDMKNERFYNIYSAIIDKFSDD